MHRVHLQQAFRQRHALRTLRHVMPIAPLALCGLLAACSADKNPAAHQRPVDDASVAPVPMKPQPLVARPDTAGATQEPAPAPAVEMEMEVDVKDSEPVPQQETADQQPSMRQPALDLSYQPGAGDGDLQGGPLPSTNRLPDLFGQDKAGRKISVSGGVMLDEESEELVDSINGAELKLQIKTR